MGIGGGDERCLAGGTGWVVQTLGVGSERPCINVLISPLLDSFLYHLICEGIISNTHTITS